MTQTCEMWPNQKKADYTRHARQPLNVRKRVAEESAETVLSYYREIHSGGDGRLPTETEKQRLERLADYILAEDHAKGLAILRDPYERPDDPYAFAAPGEGALDFIRTRGIVIHCLADAEELADGKRVKVCRSCGHPFEDRSRAGNAKDCGPSCRTRSDTLGKRISRYGTVELDGERSRMKLEYSFYSPKEMRELEERSQQAQGSPEEIDKMAYAKKRKETEAVKNTVRLREEPGHYEWVSNRNGARYKQPDIWWGPITTYNLKDRPLTENLVGFRPSFCQRYLRHLGLRWERRVRFRYLIYAVNGYKLAERGRTV